MSEVAPTQWPDKNPSDVADYSADFTEFLESAELITTKVVTPPAGITVDRSSISTDSKKIIVWLSGGMDDNSYEISVEITTNSSPDARTFKRYWAIRVVEKL